MKPLLSGLLSVSLALGALPAFAEDGATTTSSSMSADDSSSSDSSGAESSSSSSSAVSSSSSRRAVACEGTNGRTRILCIQNNIAQQSRRAARIIREVTNNRQVIRRTREERKEIRLNALKTSIRQRQTERREGRKECNELELGRERAACLLKNLTGRTRFFEPAPARSSSSSSSSSVESSSSSSESSESSSSSETSSSSSSN